MLLVDSLASTAMAWGPGDTPGGRPMSRLRFVRCGGGEYVLAACAITVFSTSSPLSSGIHNASYYLKVAM